RMSVLLFALALLAGAGDAALAVGDPAPPLDVVSPEGHSSRATLGGEVVVVDFFATWCEPCHRALRDLVAIREGLGPRLRFVLVDVGEPPAMVKEFLARNPVPGDAQVTIDSSGEI